MPQALGRKARSKAHLRHFRTGCTVSESNHLILHPLSHGWDENLFRSYSDMASRCWALQFSMLRLSEVFGLTTIAGSGSSAPAFCFCLAPLGTPVTFKNVSRQPRRIFLTCTLLVLGAVFGHAAEHEGWIKGIFHCDNCESCPDSKSECPSHSHHAADYECHSYPEGTLPALTIPSAFAGCAVDIAPLASPIVLSFREWFVLTAPPADPPWCLPPWMLMSGCAPLLI